LTSENCPREPASSRRGETRVHHCANEDAYEQQAQSGPGHPRRYRIDLDELDFESLREFSATRDLDHEQQAAVTERVDDALEW